MAQFLVDVFEKDIAAVAFAIVEDVDHMVERAVHPQPSPCQPRCFEGNKRQRHNVKKIVIRFEFIGRDIWGHALF